MEPYFSQSGKRLMGRLHLEIHPELLQLLVTIQDLDIFCEMSVKGSNWKGITYISFIRMISSYETATIHISTSEKAAPAWMLPKKNMKI